MHTFPRFGAESRKKEGEVCTPPEIMHTFPKQASATGSGLERRNRKNIGKPKDSGLDPNEVMMPAPNAPTASVSESNRVWAGAKRKRKDERSPVGAIA